MPNTFPKHSKLCGQEHITALYKSGHRFVAWPLRVTWQRLSDLSPSNLPPLGGPGGAGESKGSSQVLVWAPKSLFKHAVDRNYLRRLMREAYRLNQGLLGEGHYQIAFNYIDKERQPYAVIEKAVCKALKKINGK